MPICGRVLTSISKVYDLDSWLHGFDDTEAAILETVDLVKNHPLVPKDIVVRGYIMDSTTGELTTI